MPVFTSLIHHAVSAAESAAETVTEAVTEASAETAAAPAASGIFFTDGGDGYGVPTTAGYALIIVIAIAVFLIAWALSSKFTKRKSLSPKQLAFCAMALALAFVTSYVHLFSLPYGGSVTLFSMLFIVLVGYWYGTAVGVMVGLVYGILQFLQEPYFLSFFQVFFDYLLAFALLGVSGVFRNAKHGLVKGYIAGALLRGVSHTIGGYLFWMEYMPDNFPKSLTAIYPIVYNYSYILAEGVITVIVLCIPAVSKAMARVKKMATE